MRDYYFGIVLFFVCALLISGGTLVQPVPAVHGANADKLRDKIDQRKDRIAALEEEIEKFETQVQTTSQKTDTLENKIASLRASQRKIQAEIEVMQNKISSKNYTLEKLASEINDIKERITNHRQAVAETIQKINEADETSLVEMMLLHNDISGFYNDIETLDSFQDQVRTRVATLHNLKADREQKRQETKETKAELEDLQAQLSDKNEVLTYNKQETREVFNKTKSKEERYRDLLQEKKRQKEEFLKELNRLESELQIAIDETKFPEPGSKVLATPLPEVGKQSCWSGGGDLANCVTQYFGNTSFSKRTNAYSGNGHNGADFRASVGTPVTAASEGTVQAVGNTDRFAGCYSYGKWILIKHNNGLSTLYAHLSVISVQEGQSVTPATVVGYTGNTGYSTGPHLHFTTYASEGVRVVQYTDSNNCKQATIPIADHDAYLDPFNYLSI